MVHDLPTGTGTIISNDRSGTSTHKSFIFVSFGPQRMDICQKTSNILINNLGHSLCVSGTATSDQRFLVLNIRKTSHYIIKSLIFVLQRLLRVSASAQIAGLQRKVVKCITNQLATKVASRRSPVQSLIATSKLLCVSPP